MDIPETDEDVDLILRHVSRQFPEEFARALAPPGSEVTAATWLDTQITSRQRRLDRVLDVTTNGERQHEHTEWQMAMEADLPYRIFEYHTMIAMALVGDTPSDRSKPPIRSTVVLLSGREKRWPAEGRYRTSPRNAPFFGVTFRIDAVYQRTVAELEARGPLWMIFAPLAVDADPERMRRVLARLRAETSQGKLEERKLEELTAALVVMTDVDRRRRGLRSVIVPLLNEEFVVQNWLYKQGEQKGLEKGIAPARKALVLLYETRFGAMPAPLRERVQATHDPDLVGRWCDLVSEGTREDVDGALGAG